MYRPTFLHLALLLLLTTAGCATVGGGGGSGPTVPSLAGAWDGSITIEGQRLPSSVEVTQDGSDVELVTLVPELGLRSIGQGTVFPDGRLRSSFSYDLECPGEAEMVGSLSSDGTVLSGTLLARDCTGTLEGTFSYRR